MNNSDNLFALVKDGNKQAFETLFKAHYSNLCSYANTFVSDEELAQDIVQDFLFHVWEIKEQLPIEIPLRAFLFKSVHNRCLNVIKHQKIQERHKDFVFNDYKEAFYEEHFAEPNELHEKLRQAIDKLPQERKKAFLMHRYDELKYKEIAEKLNISVKTVENQIGKALQFLRDELKDYLPTFILLLGITIIKYLKL